MRTYRSIAETIGVGLCEAEDPTSGWFDSVKHERGEIGFGVVHWRDRRVTPAGLYRFLKLAAYALDEGLMREPVDWRRIYLVHMAIKHLARRARVRIPRELTTLERRRVKALLVGVPSSSPLRNKAFQWSRR